MKKYIPQPDGSGLPPAARRVCQSPDASAVSCSRIDAAAIYNSTPSATLTVLPLLASVVSLNTLAAAARSEARELVLVEFLKSASCLGTQDTTQIRKEMLHENIPGDKICLIYLDVLGFEIVERRCQLYTVGARNLKNLLVVCYKEVNAMPTVRGEGVEVQIKGFRIAGAFVCHQLVLDEVVDALVGESGLCAIFRVKSCGCGCFLTEPGDEDGVDRKEPR